MGFSNFSTFLSPLHCCDRKIMQKFITYRSNDIVQFTFFFISLPGSSSPPLSSFPWRAPYFIFYRKIETNRIVFMMGIGNDVVCAWHWCGTMSEGGSSTYSYHIFCFIRFQVSLLCQIIYIFRFVIRVAFTLMINSIFRVLHFNGIYATILNGSEREREKKNESK